MMSLSRRPDAHADGIATIVPQEMRDKLALDLANGPRHLRVNAIIKRCADRHDMSVETLKAPGRKAKPLAARNEAIRLVHEVFPDISTPQLGKMFGGRDHTTILNALGRTAVARKRGARP